MKLVKTLVFLALWAIFGISSAAATPVATLLQNGEQTFLDANGKPLSGGSVFFYIPSTTTPKTTWQDQAETTPNANPVVLDSAGRAIIYGSGTYRQQVKDSLGNLIWDQLTADIFSIITTNTSVIYYCGTTTGSLNAQVCTPPIVPSAYAAGQIYQFIAGFTNTAAATLQITGLSAQSLKFNGGAVVAGQIVAGVIYQAVYDGASFQLVAAGTTAPSGSVTSVGIIPPAKGISVVGSPVTTSGNMTLSLANDLSALSGFAAGTGISARTAVDTWSLRTITGGAGIATTNGDGVAGNPTVQTDRPSVAEWGGNAGGTGNAQTVTLSPAPGAYSTGMVVTFKATASNSGPTTLNVNGLGVKNIFTSYNTAMIGGELLIGLTYSVVYDGTQFQLYSLPGSVPILNIINTFTGVPQIIASATAGAAQEDALQLRRDHGAGAANDNLEAIGLYGKSAANTLRGFGYMTAQITNATDGAETGRLMFQTRVAGANSTRLNVSNGVWSNGSSGDPGADKINFVDYQANGVPVGTLAQSWGSTSGGAANAQTVTLAPVPTAYTNGMVVTFKAGFTNTNTLTMSVNGLGAKNVFLANTSTTGGEVIVNKLYALIYDGTQFQLLSPTATQHGGLVNIQTFSTAGTSSYTPTAGTFTYVAEVVGAGGGGGGAALTGAGAVAVGSCGAGGGYARKTGLVTAISGATITVGTHGNAGTAGNNNGTAGTASSIGAVVVAGGGGAGQGMAATAAPTLQGGTDTQGIGTAGDLLLSGSGSDSLQEPVSTVVQGCSGGASPVYGGKKRGQGSTTGATGQAADNPGSGGTGGMNIASQGTGKAGGDGKDGLVVIWEYN